MSKRKPTPKKRGGPRKGAGRPPTITDEANRRRKRTVWLTDAEAEYAAVIGGTLSEGVQWLIAENRG